MAEMTPERIAEKPMSERVGEAVRALAELEDAFAAALGFSETGEGWPAPDFGFDDYDNSWELWGARPDWWPTDEQIAAVWALGFSQGWICFSDGTEVHVTPRTRGERRESRHGGSTSAMREYKLRRARQEIADLRDASEAAWLDIQQWCRFGRELRKKVPNPYFSTLTPTKADIKKSEHVLDRLSAALAPHSSGETGGTT